MSDLQRVMLIEDDDDIRSIALIALETVAGFTVKCCTSGAEGLAHVDDFKPDLILLDVMMPDLDGPATLKKLRANSNLDGVPVVFMTAKVRDDEIQEFLKLGALDVIRKPFDPMGLGQLVRAIWSRAKTE